MKTAEEIFQECADNSFVFATQTQAIKAMKLYANAKLDEAAKNHKDTHSSLSAYEYAIKDILELKDKI